MAKIIAIKSDKTIYEGDIFMVMSNYKVGDKVQISRYFHQLVGKPIAEGEIIEDGITSLKSEIPNASENTIKAWSRYRKVKVTKIK